MDHHQHSVGTPVGTGQHPGRHSASTPVGTRPAPRLVRCEKYAEKLPFSGQKRYLRACRWTGIDRF
jgi:hypothetical protein